MSLFFPEFGFLKNQICEHTCENQRDSGDTFDDRAPHTGRRRGGTRAQRTNGRHAIVGDAGSPSRPAFFEKSLPTCLQVNRDHGGIAGLGKPRANSAYIYIWFARCQRFECTLNAIKYNRFVEAVFPKCRFFFRNSGSSKTKFASTLAKIKGTAAIHLTTVPRTQAGGEEEHAHRERTGDTQ